MSINVELEALIDKAGRQEVFNMARAIGWGPYDTPPEWVWRSIACQILEKKA